MNKKRYYQLRDEYENVQEDSLDDWKDSLGKEWEEWCDLDSKLDDFLEMKIFEEAVDMIFVLAPISGFNPTKIKQILNDSDCLAFVYSVYIAGACKEDRNKHPEKEQWEKEFFEQEKEGKDENE